MDKTLESYNLSIELESFFKKNKSTEFSTSEFVDITSALNYLGSSSSRKKVVEFFKTLPKEELVARCSAIAKYISLLNKLKNNSYGL